ncbi:hypothetical protein I3842_03G135600 [Carya illinoinensis]|uniref:STAS domain-containing protein n=1 Tax=Carya illinoinensis TaxID=32201 RepID=A0A922FJI9_CARIL|nr:hypothetical protein I3842_03G135600 [Carya illinoinensis]
MAAPAMETFRPEEIPDLEKSGQAERAQWVLNAPEPPGAWRELIHSGRETFLRPCGNKLLALKNQPGPEQVVLFLQGIFPILVWCRSYTVKKFKNDLLAGLTIASLCIPQSIGYATLAKLDPQYGLYTSVVPPLIYAVMGTSREIAIGPVAVVSLLLPSMIQKLQDPVADPVSYTKLVLTATFFAGIFQAAFGLFRLGFLVDFLSHAAIVGFVAGAAIVIGLQQLKGLLGISHFTNKTDIISVGEAVWSSVHHHWSPYNFILGCSFLIFILFTRFLGRRKKRLFWLPAIAPLLSVILSTLIVFLTRADKHGIKIVKHIKGGLNPSSLHQLQLDGPQVGEVAKAGLVVAVVALTEAIAVGRSFSSMKGYNLDGNKEMVAMGFMNVIGSFTSCYVATAILASIILSALPGLIDLSAAYNIWKIDKLDFLTCIAAFFGVLFVSVEIGLLVAVGISFAKIILISIRPGTETLGRIPGTDVFCDINQYPMASKTPGVVIIRVKSAVLCFANANIIKESIMKWVTEDQAEDTKANVKGPNYKLVILDTSGLMDIDTSGIASLQELHKNLTSHGIELAIANPRWQVIHKLRLANFVGKIGGRVYLTVGEAMDNAAAPDAERATIQA